MLRNLRDGAVRTRGRDALWLRVLLAAERNMMNAKEERKKSRDASIECCAKTVGQKVEECSIIFLGRGSELRTVVAVFPGKTIVPGSPLV